MPKVKLDNVFTLTASCPADKGKVDYWDTITTGFVLEVQPPAGRPTISATTTSMVANAS